MDKMVNVYFFGKKYSVPADLTIMTAMEYGNPGSMDENRGSKCISYH